MSIIESSYNVIKSPIITEKATNGRAKYNKYFFFVDLKTNKSQIKNAIEEIFEVSVVSVNTQVMYGKKKRLGKYLGRKSRRKKAVVTLEQGNRIKLMEGP